LIRRQAATSTACSLKATSGTAATNRPRAAVTPGNCSLEVSNFEREVQGRALSERLKQFDGRRTVWNKQFAHLLPLIHDQGLATDFLVWTLGLPEGGLNFRDGKAQQG
jgi:hypothetical protein